MERSKTLSKMNKTHATLVFLLMGSMVAHAGGPWPQGKGNGYFKLSEWWIVFDRHYTDAGMTDPNVTTGIYNTALYAEYGLTDRLTGIVYAPLFSRTYMNNLVSNTTGETLVAGEALNSIGDIDVSLKFTLTGAEVKIPVSASIQLGLPTGATDGGSQGNLQTGDGEFNQMLRLDAATSIPLGENTGSYLSGYAGLNNRTNGFSEEFRYGVEYGLGLLQRKLWLIGRLDGVESFNNGDTVETTTSTSIFANNTEFTSASVEAAYYVTKSIGISFAYATAFRGKIIAAAPSYSVGVLYDLK